MAHGLSQTWTILRGSVGGVTYTKTRTQAITARTRIAPSNQSTNDRVTIRGAMAFASAAWNSMSAGDRALWAAYAATVTYTGPTGSYVLTGRESFIASYALARYANQQGISSVSLGDAPPIVPGRYNPDSPQLGAPTAPGTGFSITVTNQTGEDGVLLYQRSIAYNPARNSFKGPWLAGTYAGLAIPTGASTSIDVIGLAAGLRYFFKLRAITDAEPLRISNEWILDGIAAVTT